MKNLMILVSLIAVVILGVIIYNVPKNVKPQSEPIPAADAKEQPSAVVPEQASPQEETPPAPTNEETGSKLHEILMSAVEYYNDTKGSTLIITQNGYLYNGAADIIVSPQYLVMRQYLPEGYDLDGSLIIYVSPDDISEIIPMYSERDEQLKIYALAQQGDEYLIDTTGEEQVTITKNQLDSLLEKYKTNHGTKQRVTASTEDYPSINKALQEYEKVSADFYIRYGMRDDKYLSLIASPKDNYSSIKEYILIKNGEKWEVRIPNLEDVPDSKAIVNKNCKDLDINLMPVYNLYDHLAKMNTDFAGLTDALVRDGYIADENRAIEYITSTDKFLYAKFLSGELIVGVYDGEKWVLGQVANAENALGRFHMEDERAADFVIIWE